MLFGEILDKAEKRKQAMYPDIGREWECPDLPRKYTGKPSGRYKSPADRKLNAERNYYRNPNSYADWQFAPDGAMDVYAEICRMWGAGLTIHAADIPKEVRDWLLSPNTAHPHIGLIRVTPDGQVVLLDDRKRASFVEPPDGRKRTPVPTPILNAVIEDSYANNPHVTVHEIMRNVNDRVHGEPVRGTDIVIPPEFDADVKATRVKKLRDRNDNIAMTERPTTHRWAHGWQKTSGTYAVYGREPKHCLCGCGTEILKSNQKYVDAAHKMRHRRASA